MSNLIKSEWYRINHTSPSLRVILLILFGCVSFSFLGGEMAGFARSSVKLQNNDYTQPVKITCFDKDMTELAIKLNEYVDVQQEQAAEYVKERTRLNNVISGLSHDFRTPLTASLGYLQLIEKSDELSDKNMEYLNQLW